MKWLYSKLENILLAIGFLTKFPIPGNLNYSSNKLADGLFFAPLIGVLIGVLLVLVNILTSILFPNYIVAAIVLAIYVYITGGLHIDGLGDLGDGWLSGRKKDAFYKVMKDSRLGTGGFLTITFVLFFDYLFLIETMNWKVLLFLPVAGRLGMLFGAVIGSYPKEYDGSGKLFINGTNIKNSWWLFLVILVLSFILFNWQGLLIFVSLLVNTFILVRLWSNRLDGITGDMLGALVEYSQVTYLILVYIIFV
jgi:adenosylcobinamide-GDP ribazoletransferase